jgi:hypothetical protein
MGRPASGGPAAPVGRTRTRSNRWARRIAARYGLTLTEARAELRRCAANGWQTWEFHARFAPERKDDIA